MNTQEALDRLLELSNEGASQRARSEREAREQRKGAPASSPPNDEPVNGHLDDVCLVDDRAHLVDDPEGDSAHLVDDPEGDSAHLVDDPEGDRAHLVDDPEGDRAHLDDVRLVDDQAHPVDDRGPNHRGAPTSSPIENANELPILVGG